MLVRVKDLNITYINCSCNLPTQLIFLIDIIGYINLIRFLNLFFVIKDKLHFLFSKAMLKIPEILHFGNS